MNSAAGGGHAALDQVAHVLARKFGWRIHPSGPAAQNIIGLSTQVPASFVYLSDGPKRSYQVGNAMLTFEHTALKETNLTRRESALIVQAIKSLGQQRITPQVVADERRHRSVLAPRCRDAQ